MTDLQLNAAYLLDTNILSESSKPRPDGRCLAFLEQLHLDRVFVSVVTLGELRRGLLMVSNPVKRATLLHWLEGSMYTQHGGQILNIDDGVMRTWASLIIATGKKLGQLPALDSLIAATALHHNLTVATRNTADFQQFGVPLFNPFEETL